MEVFIYIIIICVYASSPVTVFMKVSEVSCYVHRHTESIGMSTLADCMGVISVVIITFSGLSLRCQLV